jgi:hypothetical protein
MNTKTRLVLILTLALLAGAALVVMSQAAPGAAPLTQGGAPAVVSYQGEVRVSGTPYTGDGYFKFAVVNAAGTRTFWSNDGSSTGGSEPTAAVQLTVSEGLFSVLLGNTTLGGMTQALEAEVFSQPDRYLRVWFSASTGGPFSQLAPDTRIAAVPYALQAEKVKGYANVVVVAKSGGDDTSVQAAIDSITDAAADNPYLVWVAPGVYQEQVTMKPYVHLQGAGQEATVITSTASSGSAWPPTQATLVLASDTSLRDLTVGNSGAGDSNAALLATAGMTRTLVSDVTARAQGSGAVNFAIFLGGSGTDVTLQQVTALAENGSDHNMGLYNYDRAAATLHGGSFTGRGGMKTAIGINNVFSATLDAVGVTALGEDGSDTNYGLSNYSGAEATLRGGSFTARGGSIAYGIASGFNSARLEAAGVTVLAEKGSSDNTGLINYSVAVATLRGGSFTGRGGENAFGIGSLDNGTTLDAESVTALAENGSGSNQGLVNNGGAAATLRGGSYTGRGGVTVYGIDNDGSGTTLEAESITAAGENGSTHNYGLHNHNFAKAVLRGGAFTGRGGTEARGISNGSGSNLDAASVTALGENGSSYSDGLVNYGVAALRGGAFTGREGINARGIYNSNSSSVTLAAERVTALGRDGISTNYGLHNDNSATATADSSQFIGSSNGLYQESGTVHLGVSQLDGGATRISGTLTCFQVYDGSYAAYSCP